MVIIVHLKWKDEENIFSILMLCNQKKYIHIYIVLCVYIGIDMKIMFHSAYPLYFIPNVKFFSIFINMHFEKKKIQESSSGFMNYRNELDQSTVN